jgi:hypothetical protein
MLSIRVPGRILFFTYRPCSKPVCVCVEVNLLVIYLGPNQSETCIVKSFRQRCFPKRVSGRSRFFNILVLFKTYVCRCELFGNQPGPQSIPNGPFRIVPATMLSKRVCGRGPFSTYWVCSKPMCVDVNCLVISHGPQSIPNEPFRIVPATMLSKRVSGRSRFSHTGSVQHRCVSMYVVVVISPGPNQCETVSQTLPATMFSKRVSGRRPVLK